MDIDMDKVDDYNINLKEEPAIYKEQEVDYSAEFRKYLNLCDQIEEREDGTKILKLNTLKGLTPELINKVSVMNGPIHHVSVEKYDGKSHGVLETSKEESEYTIKETKDCLSKLQELVGDLKHNTQLSQTEKVLLVSKRISEGIVYDNELVAKERMGDASKRESKRGRNLTGALLDGKAVCAGYADTFNQAMEELDIPSRYIGGYTYQNSQFQGHAWNQVQLEDGNWYNIDVTAMDQENEKYLQKMEQNNEKILARNYLKSALLLKSDDNFNMISEQELSKYNTREELIASKVDAVRNYIYIPLFATKGQQIEQCNGNLPVNKKFEAIENIENYEETLGLKPTEEKQQKLGFFKRARSFFRGNRTQTLALPEPEQEIHEANLQEQTYKSKTNEFRQSIKVKPEELQLIQKSSDKNIQIQKNDYER